MMRPDMPRNLTLLVRNIILMKMAGYILNARRPMQTDIVDSEFLMKLDLKSLAIKQTQQPLSEWRCNLASIQLKKDGIRSLDSIKMLYHSSFIL